MHKLADYYPPLPPDVMQLGPYQHCRWQLRLDRARLLQPHAGTSAYNLQISKAVPNVGCVLRRSLSHCDCLTFHGRLSGPNNCFQQDAMPKADFVKLGKRQLLETRMHSSGGVEQTATKTRVSVANLTSEKQKKAKRPKGLGDDLNSILVHHV